MQFFKRHESYDNLKPPVDWGTGEPQNTKFDPTLVKGPTFLLRNQPVTQFYRESNLELSNLRAHDQLLPNALEENLLEKQNPKRFPMNHPMTSQISQKAVFPDFVAPEDPYRGQQALQTSLLNPKTPAQSDPTTVVNKTSGKPWRHEIRHEKMPSKKQGVWFNDKEYYQYPKPDQTQVFYPHPSTMLAPNRRLPSPEQQIDSRTTNVLVNKDRELMQTTYQSDYYGDGLGTRAPLNSDDLNEKVARFQATGQLDEQMMRPYFKRGEGISMSTAKSNDDQLVYQTDSEWEPSSKGPKIMTGVERDEARMENGKDYINFPQSSFQNNPKYPTFRNLGRSKTMIELNRTDEDRNKYKMNKLGVEKMRIDQENKERIQQIQMNNRQKELDLIGPRENIQLLRLKYGSLEKPRDHNPGPFLPVNFKQYVQTFYDHERKHLGERAELYRNPSVYDPRLLAQHVELNKESAPMTRFYTDGSPFISSHLDGRPVRFADHVFDKHLNESRGPLETLLLDPSSSAQTVVQEGGLILQQTTYGTSYNTKKFLQENKLVAREPRVYEKFPKSELDAQDLVLKEKQSNTKSEPTGYPRVLGPIPPEPYEPLYCSNDISEMSDGYSKRDHQRVYSSPHTRFMPRYEPLTRDIEAMRSFELAQIKAAEERDARLQEAHKARMEKAKSEEFTHTQPDIAARRNLDKPSEIASEVNAPPRSTYTASYQPYQFESTVKNPPNQFYKDQEYSGGSKPADLIEMQDEWSKSLANRRFHSALQSRSTDLRLPGGKKKVKNISITVL